MITPSVGVWMQRWIEREKGMGSRNDGCFLYPSKEAAIEGTRKLVDEARASESALGFSSTNPPDEYSTPLGDPIFFQVEPDLANEVSEKGEVFRRYWLQ